MSGDGGGAGDRGNGATGPSGADTNADDAADDPSNGPWDTFGGYLRSQRHLAQLSLRQLADLTKVSNPYLSQIERGLHQPSIAVIKSLAQALNLSVGDLLAHAADIVTGEDTPSTTESSIRRDSRLNDSQKSALLAVYSSMVSESGRAAGMGTDGAAGSAPGGRSGAGGSGQDRVEKSGPTPG